MPAPHNAPCGKDMYFSCLPTIRYASFWTASAPLFTSVHIYYIAVLLQYFISFFAPDLCRRHFARPSPTPAPIVNEFEPGLGVVGVPYGLATVSWQSQNEF